MAQKHQDTVDGLRRKVKELENRLSECRAARDEALVENQKAFEQHAAITEV